MVQCLEDFAELAVRCREHGFGFAEFRRQDSVIDLRWPDDPLEQWVYDHSGNGSFLRDYRQVDLAAIGWQVEAVLTSEFMTMPTGPSDADDIERYAENHEYWLGVRNKGVHVGAELAWEIHGSWKRWPIVLERALLAPPTAGLQLVEGRNRVGILRGRQRDGKLVAPGHLAWVGRQRVC